MDTSTPQSNNASVIEKREEPTPPFNDEHPLGVGQQCFKCGAYNDLEAGTCWHCSSDLTHSMVETPGVVESVMATGEEEGLRSIPAATPSDSNSNS